MFSRHGNVLVTVLSPWLLQMMKKTISTKTFSCRNGWIEGLCGRWIHIGQIDLKPLCKYMYIEFSTENSTVLCLSLKEKNEIWVQVRCGAQRGHSLHRRSQPPSVGRSRSSLCHPGVQRQSQCLREYQKLFSFLFSVSVSVSETINVPPSSTMSKSRFAWVSETVHLRTQLVLF